ncbi:MAG: tetratricopeptide repeat protein, partial [Bacteroidaceae bacterium]|nr:tetratricopeptide repeat protein [Bacteroidaceae bacterium]
TYCIKYASLLRIQPKVKPEELKAAHTQYQNMSFNLAIQLLQAAQKYSNSESQEDLKKGAKYSGLFLYALEESELMKDVEESELMKSLQKVNPEASRENWRTYATAFRAQSFLGIEGTPEATIVEVYRKLMNTRYKGIAYQSLGNYYREKDMAKQNQYLAEGIEALKGDPEQNDLRANFAIILMQNQFQKGEKEAFKKTAKLIKEEFSDNSNAINAYLMEGQMAFEDKQYDEAKAIFLEAKSKFPDEPKCLLMAARSAWQKAIVGGSKKADMDEAIQLFKQLEAEDADDPEMWGEPLYILYNNTQQPALAAKYKQYYKATK